MPGQIPRIRKRICYATKYPTEEVIDILNQKLEDPSSNLEGHWLDDELILNLPENNRQPWSPRMKFIISPKEEDEGFGFIKGFVEPQSFLWTLFIAFYTLIGILGILGSIYGFKKFRLEGDPDLLWFIPATLLFLTSFFLLSKLGQRMLDEQIDIMNTFIRDIRAETPHKRLVNANELTPLLGLDFLGKGGDLFSKLLLYISGFTQLNQVYSGKEHRYGKSLYLL